MTADLLRFALEDARSAAVRVQLATNRKPRDEAREDLLWTIAEHLDCAVRALELLTKAEAE